MYRERKRKNTSLNAMIFIDTRYFHFIKCKPDKHRGILLDLVFSNLSTNFHFTMNDSLLNYRLLFRQFPMISKLDIHAIHVSSRQRIDRGRATESRLCLSYETCNEEGILDPDIAEFGSSSVATSTRRRPMTKIVVHE